VTAPHDADRAATAGAPEPAAQPWGAIYAAVIVAEILTLLALWWFQTTFARA
jgi:hypothetical protein